MKYAFRHAALPPLLAAVLTAAVLLPSPALGQLDRLDVGTFVDGLRREGMGELLEHLARTEASDDPIFKSQVLISQLLLNYAQKAQAAREAVDPAAATALTEEGQAHFAEALDLMRGLITDYPDHSQRAIWQTNLAEQLLLEKLQTMNNYAAEFYELGVPTQEQIEAYESVAPEALRLMVSADLRLFEQQTAIPKLADFKEAYENTGLWDRMMNEYYKLRVPYFLGLAAHYTANLRQDTHPYFQNLKKDPVIPAQLQESSASAERRRLERLVVERMIRVRDENRDLPENVELFSQMLEGRAKVALEDGRGAEEAVAPVILKGYPDLTSFSAAATKAYALELQKQHVAADTAAEALARHPLASSNLSIRLMATDVMHRLRLARAMAAPQETRAQAISDAYHVYVEMLADPRLESSADALRYFIYQRWGSNLDPNQPLASIPDLVLMAVGQTAREAGQNLLWEAQQAMEAGDEEGAAELRKQAMPRFEQSIKTNVALLSRSTADDLTRATAMYNQALSIYFSDQYDDATMARAANLLVDLAYLFPEQEIARTGITQGVGGLLQPMYAQAGVSQDVRDSYVRGARVLLNKFPTLEATDNIRLHYAQEVLMQNKSDWAAAAKVLSELPREHPDYWGAQQQMLYSLLQWYRELVAEAATAAAEEAAATEPAAAATGDDAAAGAAGEAAAGGEATPAATAGDDATATTPAAPATPVAATPATPATPAPATPAVTPASAPLGSELEDPRPPAMTADEVAQWLITAGTDLRQLAEQQLEGGHDPEVEARIRSAAGHARLYLSELYVERDAPELALAQVVNFANEFAALPDLVKFGLGKELEALVKLGRYDRTEEIAQSMMRNYPDHAAAVINQVLVEIERMIESLSDQIAHEIADRRRAELEQTREQVTDAAVSLARLLLDWAVGQGYAAEEMIPFQVTYARSARLAGDYAEARQILEELRRQDLAAMQAEPGRGPNGAILHNLAEVYFAQGDDKSLLEAAKLYDILIAGLGRGQDGKYPPNWWNAWSRRLQISDRLGQFTNDIPFRVRQLEEGTDRNLGGEPYRTRLKQLELKYAT